MRIRSLAGLAGLAVIACIVASAAEARITKLTITRVESPPSRAAASAVSAPGDKLVGRATGEVDPKDPRNAIITDIALAPRNARGMVEYETDVLMLRPTDRRKSNYRLWYELTNRGRVLSFAQFNDADEINTPTSAADAGNGFLMRQGYNILISGWDISAPAGGGSFTMKAPVVANPTARH